LLGNPQTRKEQKEKESEDKTKAKANRGEGKRRRSVQGPKEPHWETTNERGEERRILGRAREKGENLDTRKREVQGYQGNEGKRGESRPSGVTWSACGTIAGGKSHGFWPAQEGKQARSRKPR